MKALDHFQRGEIALEDATGYAPDESMFMGLMALAQAHFTAALAACAAGYTERDPTEPGPEPLPARDDWRDDWRAHRANRPLHRHDPDEARAMREFQQGLEYAQDRPLAPLEVTDDRTPADWLPEHAHHAHPVASCPYCEGTEPEGFHP